MTAVGKRIAAENRISIATAHLIVTSGNTSQMLAAGAWS